jgi:membrane-associated protease RseP (regulator of RpoE activity)
VRGRTQQRAPAAGQERARPDRVDLTEAQKRELRVRGGVRVEAVEGAAARAGLREGDVILSLDNTEITDSAVRQRRRQGREGRRERARAAWRVDQLRGDPPGS